jgi:hypothetical protein
MTTKPEHAVADALRKVAVQLEIAIDQRRRWKHLDADDLLETLLAVADELDPPVPAKTPALPTS